MHRAKWPLSLIVVVIAVVALVIGLVSGWWFGSQSACGPACGFDVGLFEAIGTWLGGVGVSAVGAWYTLSRRHADREAAAEREAARKEAAEREIRVLALMCTVRFHPLRDAQNGYDRVHIEFENTLEEPVLWPHLWTSQGLDLGTDEQVWPTRCWGKETTLSSLGLDASYPTEKSAREALNSEGRSAVIFEYTIRNLRFARTRNNVALLNSGSLSGVAAAENGN